MMTELVNAHLIELNTLGRTIEHRAAYAEISRLERAQRALKSAGRKMHVMPNFSARTN
jgi:hypothetical protein